MQLVRGKNASFLPVVAFLVATLCLLVLDPLAAGAPWWSSGEEGFGIALLIPTIPWITCALIAIVLAALIRRSEVALLASLGSLGSLFIPAVLWNLLLSDIFPHSGIFSISMSVATFGIVAFAIMAIVLAARGLLRRAKLGAGADETTPS